MLVELGAKILGDVEHMGEVGDAAHIHPVPELLGAHLGLALRNDVGLDQSGAKLGAGQADQRRLFSCRGTGAQAVACAFGGQIE